MSVGFSANDAAGQGLIPETFLKTGTSCKQLQWKAVYRWMLFLAVIIHSNFNLFSCCGPPYSMEWPSDMAHKVISPPPHTYQMYTKQLQCLMSYGFLLKNHHVKETLQKCRDEEMAGKLPLPFRKDRQGCYVIYLYNLYFLALPLHIGRRYGLRWLLTCPLW